MARARQRKPKSGTAESTLSPAKKRLFIAGTLLLPIVFFVTLELALRIAGYGEDYPLFKPVPTTSDYLYQNPEVARRYFHKQQRVPTGLGDVFKSKKDSTEFRIFVQGGSSAAGYPYYAGGSFSRMLEQRLQQTFPDRRVEVINTALAAINSYTLLDFADEIIAQNPDAVLIYAGHNEFYGALGVASAESLGRSRSVVNLFLRLRALRIVQGLQSLLAGAASAMFADSDTPESDTTLMERMVGEQRVPFQSPLYRRGLAQFRGNLQALLRKYREHGIPVLIGTVASNERAHAPFISGLSPGTDPNHWEALYRGAQQHVVDGDLMAASRAYETLLSLDSLSADAFFGLAKAQDRMGQYPRARSSYLAAKDRDELRFRASEDINRIIREEAGKNDAVVVETQARLTAASKDGVIGSDLMLEHLHPNIDGYFIISEAFYDALRAARLIGEWTSYVSTASARKEILVTAVDSLFGEYRLRQLLGRWPFQPPGVVDRSWERIQVKDSVEQIAFDLHQRNINWYEANVRLRGYYKARGDYHRALRAGLTLIQQYPFLPGPYAEAADIMTRQGRLDEALTYYDVANGMEESAAVYYMMGAIYLVKRQTAEAERNLMRAVALQPRHTQALLQLSKLYVVSNRREEALETVRRVLEIAPEDAEGRRLMAMLVASATSSQN